MRHTSLEIACEWIIKSWNETKHDVIQESFKSCSISETEFVDVPEDIKEDEYVELFMFPDKEKLFKRCSMSETELADVPEGITEDEYDEFFMLPDSVNLYVH